MSTGGDKTLAHETLEVVFFSLAGWRLGLEAHLVRGARAALSADWTGQQGGGAATLLGFPVSHHAAISPQWLALQRADQTYEILVDGPVELVTLPVAAIQPLPQLLAARTQLRGLRALVLQGGAVSASMALLFDATVLLNDGRASPF